MNITPLEDVVIIRPHKEVVSHGGILIPRTAEEFHEDIGTVVFCGPGKRDDLGVRLPMDVEPGDRVLFSTHGHQVTKINGEELIVLKQPSIIGIITDYPAKLEAVA
jgi:chaperonin GroES